MAQRWGHGYSVLLKEEGYPVGLSSKTPIKVKTKMLGGLWHGMLHIETAAIDFLRSKTQNIKTFWTMNLIME